MPYNVKRILFGQARHRFKIFFGKGEMLAPEIAVDKLLRFVYAMVKGSHRVATVNIMHRADKVIVPLGHKVRIKIVFKTAKNIEFTTVLFFKSRYFIFVTLCFFPGKLI